jgi:hypothetical protein
MGPVGWAFSHVLDVEFVKPLFQNEYAHLAHICVVSDVRKAQVIDARRFHSPDAEERHHAQTWNHEMPISHAEETPDL